MLPIHDEGDAAAATVVRAVEQLRICDRIIP
jgi:hypothetical protein